MFDGVHVEPTDESLATAVEWARDNGPWDAVRRRRGRVEHRHRQGDQPDDDESRRADGLRQQAGRRRAEPEPAAASRWSPSPPRPAPAPRAPPICVLDVLSLKVKTGISHARLRPTMAVIDPGLTLTQPPGVTAAAGMDILCHALESYTARPYTTYERKRPEERVPYCGANPIADMWSEKAMSLLAESFRTAVRDGARRRGPRARWRWPRPSPAWASATPACTSRTPTPIRSPAGSRTSTPPDYPADEPMIPHGMSVALTAPEAFRFTFDASPERHRAAARLLDPARGRAERPRRVPAGRADRPDARHRHPRRHRRGRLRRGRRRPTWSRAR